MNKKREVRTFSAAELRANKAAEEPGISGYAAVFNKSFEQRYGTYVFREVIAPGAFTRALKEKQDVRCLVNHDENLVLGRTKNGTLTLSEDSTGLHFDCDIPDTQTAKDTRTSVDRGDIDQCSFAFITTKQTRTEEKDKDGAIIFTRTIQDLDLLDVSVVTYPAYEETSCEARKLESAPEDLAAIAKEYEARSADQKECRCECGECPENCDGCTSADCQDKQCSCKQRSRKALLELRCRVAAAE
jgi:uncharacterized protein